MIVYVSGPYSAETRAHRLENIIRAEHYAVKIWKAGHFAFCPHLNTRLFEEKVDLPYDTYIDGDIQFLLRCDAIFMVPGWERSNGAKTEHDWAIANDIPVYYNVENIPCPQG